MEEPMETRPQQRKPPYTEWMRELSRKAREPNPDAERSCEAI
jgi:hypothetical protein